jgi:hypothetical protein
MENHRRTNGLVTFLEHWGLLLTAALGLLVSQVVVFFMRLSGTPWIWFFGASFALMIIGGTLIACAKFPAYRSGRFFAFGPKSVPAHLQVYYRWGWRVFAFGVVLSLCLLWSRP